MGFESLPKTNCGNPKTIFCLNSSFRPSVLFLFYWNLLKGIWMNEPIFWCTLLKLSFRLIHVFIISLKISRSIQSVCNGFFLTETTDSRHREKTFKIEKTLSESRNKLWYPGKYFSVKKKKNYEIEKKRFGIEKNISETRKLFQNRERYFRIEKYLATRIKKKFLELNVLGIFLHNSFIAS